MGCGKSTLAHGVDSNENDVIINKEDSVKENATEPGKIEAIEAKDTPLQDSGNSGSFAPQLKNKSVSKPTMMKRKLPRARKLDTGRQIENAWGATKVQKNIENAPIKPQREKVADMDFEGEYGRDGVDLASSHVTNGYETDKLVNGTLGPRTSPDGTNFNNYKEGVNRASHKVESDETFDPSTLIDIEKFKAANVPAKQALKTKEGSENIKGNDVTENETNPPEIEIVTTLSNYSEFYDEEEKDLIASIENDFVTLSPPALPGSVM